MGHFAARIPLAHPISTIRGRTVPRLSRAIFRLSLVVSGVLVFLALLEQVVLLKDPGDHLVLCGAFAAHEVSKFLELLRLSVDNFHAVAHFSKYLEVVAESLIQRSQLAEEEAVGQVKDVENFSSVRLEVFHADDRMRLWCDFRLFQICRLDILIIRLRVLFELASVAQLPSGFSCIAIVRLARLLRQGRLSLSSLLGFSVHLLRLVHSLHF